MPKRRGERGLGLRDKPGMMQTIFLVVHVLLALTIIGLVLLQQGEGANAGAAFGSGASGTVFGARGSGSFLTRMTTMFATLFFVTSIGLAVLAAHHTDNGGSVVDTAPATQEAPAESKSAPSSKTQQSGAQAPESGSGKSQGDLPPMNKQ